MHKTFEEKKEEIITTSFFHFDQPYTNQNAQKTIKATLERFEVALNQQDISKSIMRNLFNTLMDLWPRDVHFNQDLEKEWKPIVFCAQEQQSTMLYLRFNIDKSVIDQLQNAFNQLKDCDQQQLKVMYRKKLSRMHMEQLPPIDLINLYRKSSSVNHLLTAIDDEHAHLELIATFAPRKKKPLID